MKNILVTGGAGYIGSHTVLNLLIKGYRVFIIDSFRNSSPIVIDRIQNILNNIDKNLFQNLTFIKGDIRDSYLLNELFVNAKKKGFGIDSVIHFSGLKSVAESKKIPLEYWDVNIGGTINLIRIMDLHNCRNLIFSSSATVYGDINNPLFAESCKLNPVNPYAKTKALVENLLKEIYESNKENWKFCILRYFNPIGAHKSGVIGESPLGLPNNLFPLILKASISKNQIDIFGKDWPTDDGTCIRDYVHVEDIAEGHVKALENQFFKNDSFNCFNLGTGEGTSVLELINKFEEVNNVKILYNFSSRRDGDVAILVADISNAKKQLNWIPTRSLSEMCQDGYKWITKNPDGFGI